MFIMYINTNLPTLEQIYIFRNENNIIFIIILRIIIFQ